MKETCIRIPKTKCVWHLFPAFDFYCVFANKVATQLIKTFIKIWKHLDKQLKYKCHKINQLQRQSDICDKYSFSKGFEAKGFTC